MSDMLPPGRGAPEIVPGAHLAIAVARVYSEQRPGYVPPEVIVRAAERERDDARGSMNVLVWGAGAGVVWGLIIILAMVLS